MSAHYSDPSRADDEHSLPDIEVFQLTAIEAAELDEDAVWEFSRRPEYQLCHMNSRVREAMLEAMASKLGITGGWFYWFCFPGCMPDSCAMGPYETHAEALAAAQEGVA